MVMLLGRVRVVAVRGFVIVEARGPGLAPADPLLGCAFCMWLSLERLEFLSAWRSCELKIAESALREIPRCQHNLLTERTGRAVRFSPKPIKAARVYLRRAGEDMMLRLLVSSSR